MLIMLKICSIMGIADVGYSYLLCVYQMDVTLRWCDGGNMYVLVADDEGGNMN